MMGKGDSRIRKTQTFLIGEISCTKKKRMGKE